MSEPSGTQPAADQPTADQPTQDQPETRTSSPEEAPAAGGTSDSPPAQGEGRPDSH